MLNNGRARVEESFGGLRISIPSKKNWFAIPFIAFWLVGWFWGIVGVSTIIGTTHDSPGVNGFLIIWLILWTGGGLSAIFMLLWGLFGIESLDFDRNRLSFQKTIFNIGMKRELDIQEVKNFRFEKGPEGLFNGNRWAFWGLGPGKIKFDYGLKTYSLGLGVDDAEAIYLANLLNEKLSSK